MPGEKILGVDDEPQLLEMIRVRLEAKGYKVETADDGAEGLKKVPARSDHF